MPFKDNTKYVVVWENPLDVMKFGQTAKNDRVLNKKSILHNLGALFLRKYKHAALEMFYFHSNIALAFTKDHVGPV